MLKLPNLCIAVAAGKEWSSLLLAQCERYLVWLSPCLETEFRELLCFIHVGNYYYNGILTLISTEIRAHIIVEWEFFGFYWQDILAGSGFTFHVCNSQFHRMKKNIGPIHLELKIGTKHTIMHRMYSKSSPPPPLHTCTPYFYGTTAHLR